MTYPRLPLILLITLIALFTGSCSTPDSFIVEGRIDGLGGEEIAMYYVAPADGVRHVAARTNDDGSFSVSGSSPDPVFVELFRSNGAPIATIVASDGDRIKLNMTLDRPATLTISGSEAMERYGAFVAANSSVAGQERIDRAVVDYVTKNSADLSATAVLLTMFDASRHPETADSLLNLIAVAARPASLTAGYRTLLGAACALRLGDLIKPFSVIGASDSVTGFVPSSHPWSLLVFTDPAKPDSLRSVLKGLRSEYPRRRIDILEVAVWGDSATWRREIKGDSATWRQSWVPGGVASPAISHLAIPATPFFIVADSSGRQCMRTPLASDVVGFFKKQH